MNECLQVNFLPKFSEGVIVLVKKKNSDDTLKAFRPITVLNYDYKLLARILKKRLDNIMIENRILNQNQKCANSNRTIFEAVHAIKDRIVELNSKGKRVILILFDLDHAFDGVDH